MPDFKPARSNDALTGERFYALLDRLDSHRDQAALKYEELRFKLCKFFQWSGCSSAEDLADETLTRTARKLHAGEQEIVDLDAFVWGVARHVRQEAQKRDFKTIDFSQVPDQKLSDAGASIEEIYRKIQARREKECLRKCLQRLSREDREMFLAYRVDKRHYVERRRRLAEEFGLSASALRVRVIRLREKLEKWIAKCLGS